MTAASESARVVATTCADHVAGETGYVTFHRDVPFEAELVLEPLLAEAEREIERLRQGYWDARAVMGFDNDGDPTPRALVSDMVKLMAIDAMSMRGDYDEACNESDALQAQVDAVRKIADDIAIYAGDDEGSRLDRLAAHWTTEIRAALGET